MCHRSKVGVESVDNRRPNLTDFQQRSGTAGPTHVAVLHTINTTTTMTTKYITNQS